MVNDTSFSLKTSIITPVWNRGDLTMQFLFQHWRQFALRPDVEFVIVNNGSTDNTRLILHRWAGTMKDRLKVVHNDENEGFGPGHNRGAEAASGEILVFLSNDVDVLGDYITILQGQMDGAALYGAELLKGDTGWNTFDGRTIPYLAGWCVAATRDVWDDLGGWDERYVPCDYEDLDLSYQAMKKGYKLVSLDLPLRHAFGQSARALAGGRLAITQRNRAQFMEKWGLRE